MRWAPAEVCEQILEAPMLRVLERDFWRDEEPNDFPGKAFQFVESKLPRKQSHIWMQSQDFANGEQSPGAFLILWQETKTIYNKTLFFFFKKIRVNNWL